MNFILVGDIIEANGKTIRENNMLIGHNIPIGTLVEFKTSTWHGGGACERVHARKWVIAHMRDCDGSPLYAVANIKAEEYEAVDWAGIIKSSAFGRVNGLTEEDLTPVEVTSDLARGFGALEWEEDA